MEDKTLIIYDSLEYFIPYLSDDNVDVQRLYKKQNYFFTLMKKVFIYCNIFLRRWYEDWVNNIENYDLIIVFATRDYSFLKWIDAKFDKRVIFWYWNPAFRMGLPKKELFDLAEVWSFDPDDCQKYNLKYNTTFYFKGIKLIEDKIEFDVSFLGINKGRRDELKRIEKLFNESGLKTYFHIVPDKHEDDRLGPKPICYEQYLELLSKSRAILDINPIGQSGQTLRPMESIFFRKKLITTDRNIRICDYYKKENIFVLGLDNTENLNHFINSPYIDVDDAIVNSYDAKQWLRKFNL